MAFISGPHTMPCPRLTVHTGPPSRTRSTFLYLCMSALCAHEALKGNMHDPAPGTTTLARVLTRHTYGLTAGAEYGPELKAHSRICGTAPNKISHRQSNRMWCLGQVRTVRPVRHLPAGRGQPGDARLRPGPAEQPHGALQQPPVAARHDGPGGAHDGPRQELPLHLHLVPGQ